MKENIAMEVLKQAPFGYAYHELLFNDRGQPEDYIFLDINHAFEEMTGLIGAEIIGKRVTQVLPGIRNGNFDWVDFYAKVALAGERREFTQYAEPLGRWYKVTAFSPEKGYFATLFQETTGEIAQIQELEKQKKEIEKISSDLKIIFNSTQDAMFLARIEKGDIRYIMNNTAHQKLTGYTPEEINEKTPEELLGLEMGKSLKKGYLKAVEEKHPIELEETLAFPNGTRTWHTVFTPVLEEGEVKYIVCSRKDITLQKKAEKEREYHFRRLQAMFEEHAAIMLLIEPATGKIVDANPAACAFYGYTRKELLSLQIQDLNMLSEEEVEKRRLLALKKRQRYFLFPHRLHSGEIRLVDVYSCPVTHYDGQMLFSIIFDVTDRERYKEELYREKQLLHTTLLSIGDGVVTTDSEGRIILMNKFAQEITGWGEKEASGKPFAQVFKLISEDTGEEVENPVARVFLTEKIIGLANHTALITKDGRQVSIADSAAPIRDEKGKIFGVVMVFRDVTQEKEHQGKILYMSYHDSLTGLYNRRFMEERIMKLDTSLEQPIAVIMGDVNGLKLTNDVFGHEVGDRLLQKTADAIKENCRQEDIIARWGGDEFLILLPRSTAENAENIIKRIKDSCVVKSDGPMQVSVSFGFAVKTKKEDLLQVIKEAEERMYRQKLMEGKSYRNSIINTLLATLAEKNLETEEHAERLRDYCQAMAKEIKLSAKELDELALLAVLHDIGKVGIEGSILQKPGLLNSEEWEEMKKHPEIGFRIAQNAPELSAVAEYILFHHERWDGKGYPKGLKGEDIPLLCRILAVTDAYDAMVSDRPYRKAMSREEALLEIKKNAGAQFDPEVTNVFIRMLGVENIRVHAKRGEEKDGLRGTSMIRQNKIKS
ncbi:PAS domain S-box protein [Candidatus Formimonas warabiya]|uniref:PAS domain S-box protein n=1 Tax=Formimonas warabiya TaxID=1761012 RepID=A0A3G1KSR4_FORW1|nr:PAS domain S-box protein [Candidatus Formimonas warabiya]ATW25512.1 hypothetical protein DCMF_12690 [Candidatus Formimonas warabiya]